jgi:hypothetical protein
MHRHAVQGAPGVFWYAPSFDWAWTSGAVGPLLLLQTACVLGVIGCVAPAVAPARQPALGANNGVRQGHPLRPNQQIVGTRTSAPGQCHGRDPRGLVSAGSASVRRCYDDRPGLAILSPENRERLSDVTTQRGAV